MEQPGIITIEVSDSDDVFADHADLYVKVRGSSLFTGQEALKKAREVRELVEGLTDSGLPEADILLESVRADVSSGFTGQRSSASYRLRIRCRELDELADVLGVITSQKNTGLSQMVWKYSDLEEVQTRLFEECLAKSKRKADMVAASFGLELLGVHEFHERPFIGRRLRVPDTQHDLPPAVRAESITREELGLSISHSKRVTVALTTLFRVGPLKTKRERE